MVDDTIVCKNTHGRVYAVLKVAGAQHHTLWDARNNLIDQPGQLIASDVNSVTVSISQMKCLKP